MKDTIEKRAVDYAKRRTTEDGDPNIRDLLRMVYIEVARIERNLVFAKLAELFPDEIEVEKPENYC